MVSEGTAKSVGGDSSLSNRGGQSSASGQRRSVRPPANNSVATERPDAVGGDAKVVCVR